MIHVLPTDQMKEAIFFSFFGLGFFLLFFLVRLLNQMIEKQVEGQLQDFYEQARIPKAFRRLINVRIRYR